MRSRWMWLAVVAVVLIPIAIGLLRHHQADAAAAGSDRLDDRWWLTAFEPGVAEPAAAPLASTFAGAEIVEGLRCGALDGAKVDEDGTIFVWGWARDPTVGRLAQDIVILERGQQLPVRAVMGRKRPDIAHFYGDPSLAASGWNLRVPRELAVPGEHVLRAYAVLHDGRLGELELEARILVPEMEQAE